MGKLSHIQERMKALPPIQIEGMLDAIAKSMAETVADEMRAELSRSVQATDSVHGSVNAITPAIAKAVKSAVDGIKPALAKLSKDLNKPDHGKADMLKLQAALVKELGNVRIPDYSDQLRQIEGQKTDLSPVLKKIDAIEFPETEERATRWTFKIVRNNNGLIQEVTATAG